MTFHACSLHVKFQVPSGSKRTLLPFSHRKAGSIHTPPLQLLDKRGPGYEKDTDCVCSVVIICIIDRINPTLLTGRRIDGAIRGKGSDDRTRSRRPLPLAPRCCASDELQGLLDLLAKSRQLQRTSREISLTRPFLSRWHAQLPERQPLTSTSKTRSFTMILCLRTSLFPGR